MTQSIYIDICFVEQAFRSRWKMLWRFERNALKPPDALEVCKLYVLAILAVLAAALAVLADLA